MLYDWKHLVESEVAPIEWTVHEMLLIRSLVGRTRHDVLGRYPLD